jgi:hypothetical protein
MVASGAGGMSQLEFGASNGRTVRTIRLAPRQADKEQWHTRLPNAILKNTRAQHMPHASFQFGSIDELHLSDTDEIGICVVSFSITHFPKLSDPFRICMTSLLRKTLR